MLLSAVRDPVKNCRQFCEGTDQKIKWTSLRCAFCKREKTEAGGCFMETVLLGRRGHA